MAPARGRHALLLLVLLSASNARAQRPGRPPIGAPTPTPSKPTGCLVEQKDTQSATAFCEREIKDTQQPPNTIFCSRVPNNPWATGSLPGKMTYTALDGNKRFSVGDYSNSCLVNAAVPCSLHKNPQQTNTLKDDNPSLSCCSCFLYAKFCAGTSGIPLKSPTSPAVGYVLDKVLEDSQKDPWHSLVMPKAPCTGVDNWSVTAKGLPQNGNDCPGEDIWDAAQSVIEDINYNPVLSAFSPYFGMDNIFGLAINPVSRRGEHQMHVHVSRVWPSIMASLDYQYNVVWAQSKVGTFYLDCQLAQGGKRRRLNECSIFSGTPDAYKVKVTISKHSYPASAKPFETVYGATAPPVATAATTYTSTLVVQVPSAAEKKATKVWAVVANAKGAAECFFIDDPHCQDKN